MLPQKILKIRYPRSAKIAFGVQHLLHHSIVYTFIHYRTINMDALKIAFLRSWCEFHSEFLLLSKLLQFFFLGEIFSGNSRSFLGPMVPWSDTFSTPDSDIDS